jgi:hypothetical protein
VPFTESSRFLAGNVSTITSELVRRLERAGLIVLGRTNTPEFGMVPTCEPALYGPTRNPWSTTHSTSGSSGGSAAAVASGMVPMATERSRRLDSLPRLGLWPVRSEANPGQGATRPVVRRRALRRCGRACSDPQCPRQRTPARSHRRTSARRPLSRSPAGPPAHPRGRCRSGAGYGLHGALAPRPAVSATLTALPPSMRQPSCSTPSGMSWWRRTCRGSRRRSVRARDSL